jgi:hypothetical protein
MKTNLQSKRHLLLCMFLFGCISLVELAANEVFGLVLFREGEALVTRGILEFDAQVEEVLFFDDEIETGEDSSMQITFDSSFVTIGPNTMCTIEKVEENGEEVIRLVLDQGSLRSKILNLGSRQFFEVESDSGKLRVHGTDFVAAVPEDSGSFDVSVINGRVAVEGEAGGADQTESQPMFLSERESSSVGGDSGEAAGQVSNLSLQDVDNLKEALPIPGDDSSGVPSDSGNENLVAVADFVDENVIQLIPNEDSPGSTPGGSDSSGGSSGSSDSQVTGFIEQSNAQDVAITLADLGGTDSIEEIIDAAEVLAGSSESLNVTFGGQQGL